MRSAFGVEHFAKTYMGNNEFRSLSTLTRFERNKVRHGLTMKRIANTKKQEQLPGLFVGGKTHTKSTAPYHAEMNRKEVRRINHEKDGTKTSPVKRRPW